MRQLLTYAFDADARFEGRLVGALERMESGGTLRILEIWFVGRDTESGELAAVEMRSRGAGSMVGPLLDFRLDAAKRRRATAQAGAALHKLGTTLAPGQAVAAVLVEHSWVRTLEDAVAQSGGKPLSNEFVDSETLAEAGHER